MCQLPIKNTTLLMDHQALKLLLQNQLIWFPNRWNHLIITQQALQKQARWRDWDILMMDCVSSDVFLAVIAAWCCRINAAADKQGRSDSSEARLRVFLAESAHWEINLKPWQRRSLTVAAEAAEPPLLLTGRAVPASPSSDWLLPGLQAYSNDLKWL